MDTQELIEGFEELRRTAEFPVFYLTGQAGTGKTYNIKQAIEQDPKFAQLAASTGIAGVNLGATTINQVLKYFNTDSLYDNYQSGLLQKHLRLVRKFYRNLVIDEVSMIPYQQLDLICWGLDEINDDVDPVDRLGLILVGDFAQLPPVPGDLKQNGRPIMTKDGQRTVKEPTPWAFKSELWPRFEQPGHMVKLEKIWRQSDPTFLQGINSIRRGVGTAGTGFLAAAGVEFARELDNEFDGTTIVGRNEEVDRINKIRLQKLPGNAYRLPSERWWASEVRGHKQPGEWQYIPERLELKIGAYVMVLANQKDPLTGELVVANGDCGWVREVAEIKTPIYDYDLDTTSDSDTTAVDSDTAVIVAPKIIGEQVSWLIKVELVRRPGELVTIPYITRMLESRYEPDEDLMRHPKFPRDESGQPCKVRNSMGRLVWCLGSINYFPLRLAYASTVHKSQGLSLDRVQIDPRGHFMGQPGMAYVALSRGRSPQGIRIVGNARLFAERVAVDPLVRRFI